MSDFTLTFGDPLEVSIAVPEGATQISVSIPELNPVVVNNALAVTGGSGAAGEGVEPGGTENQFLQKNSATNYDTKWSAYTLPGVDGDDGQVLTTDGAGTVSFGYPKTISENVKNVSGGTLLKGTPVHVTGSVGNLAEVIAADAVTNYPAHFVLDQDLADDGEGLGIALGFINNIDVPDASIYTEGQTVYLAPAGGWTTTKPTGANNAIQNLGIIIKVNTSGNKISGIVMGAGRSNDVPNIPEGQTWIGDASGVATPTTLATVATTGSYNDLSDTPTDTNTTYTISCVDGDNADEEKIRLTGSDASTDDVVLEAGTGLSIARDGDKITFTNTVTDTDTTYTAGDGLDLTGTAFSVDLKGSGGLVIESTELAVDLGATNITGTLRVADGGTGATTLTSDSVLTGSGTTAITAESNLTFDGSQLTITGQKLYPSTTSANQFYGDIVDFGSGPGGNDALIAQGSVYFLNSAQYWTPADADSVSLASGMLGIAIADGETKFLIKGFARSASYTGLTNGDVLYLSNTAGGITKTAPSGTTGYVVRVIGYCTSSASREIFFDPSKDWIELR